MQKQISFVITAAILLIAFVGAVLYSVEATNAQNMTKGANMTAGTNMTNATKTNMTNSSMAAKPNATD